MKRRDFLRASSTISLPVLVNGFGLKAVGRTALTGSLEQSDKVLVLIQMNGGNDGLNTVIPLDQYDQLANVRSNIVIPEQNVLGLTDSLGFHPAMSGLKEVYEQGKLSIIQGVAYPNQNRSHFRSTDIWTSGSAAEDFKDTGWLGNYFDTQFPDYPEGYPNDENPDPFALTIGSIVSETCQGVASNFSLAINDPFNLSPLSETESGGIPNNNYGSELMYVIDTIKQTNAYADTISSAADKGNNLSELYDDQSRLAQQLKTVALLIAGGLKTNVYIVTIGGFDTHANQTEDGDSEAGEHAQLLGDLSSSIRAFQDDLQKLGIEERVLGMTFSEFGRQIRSNDAFGTDHGTAAPLMLFGSCVESGILGENAEIGTNIEPQEGVAMQFDFRSVYASVLIDWFKLSEQQVEEIFFTGIQHLPIIAGCTTTSIFDQEELIQDMKVYPNPFAVNLNIEIGLTQGDYRLSLFNHLGHELRVISSQRFSTGTHQIRASLADLPSGTYYLHLRGKSTQRVKRVVKL